MMIFLNHIKVQLKEENPLIYSLDIDKVRYIYIYIYHIDPMCKLQK